MRKLKLQVQMTVDGYIAGPNGEMDFFTFNWGDDIKNHVAGITDPIDTIVLGRKLAEGFIPYWAGVAADASNPDQKAGKKFTDTSKVVFSKTLDKSKWANTEVANGNIADEINKLKQQRGKDIMAYGGANFVSSLIKNGLIDEYNLFVNPAAIGSGLPIFRELPSRQSLKLVQSKAFDCGIVLLNYQVAR